jgi:hypothetical protein
MISIEKLGCGRVPAFDLALAGNVSLVVDLDGRAGPGAIEVSFDGHIVCRRSEEAFVDWGANKSWC